MTLTWNGKRFDWVNVGWFAALHAGALLAPWTFTWTGLVAALALWWLSGSIGICLTYHRLLTHRGFRVPKPLEYLGTLAGMLASEGGAISWVAMHRIHHAKSDQSGEDLHTPKDGFLWSHIGWVLCKVGIGRTRDGAALGPRARGRPGAPRAQPPPLGPERPARPRLYAWGGWPLVVWGVFVRLLLTVHGTWFVNSATHTWGYRTWQTKDDSRNLWWVGLVAWGEGWHNTHHAFQRSARHGFGRELDVTWLRDPRARRGRPGDRHPAAAEERRALPDPTAGGSGAGAGDRRRRRVGRGLVRRGPTGNGSPADAHAVLHEVPPALEGRPGRPRECRRRSLKWTRAGSTRVSLSFTSTANQGLRPDVTRKSTSRPSRSRR